MVARSHTRLGLAFRVLALAAGLATSLTCFGQNSDDLRTVAERSDFKATARHTEVVDLLDRLAARSTLARRAEMGKTGEGRTIPLLIVADPPVENASQARERGQQGKLVALLMGNIHAGEVDGKEALPTLAREVLTTEHHPWLKDYVLVFAPIFNADGNERVAKTNRPGQVGPEEGMGQRANAAGFDLNRDFTRLETPEARALVRFFNDWDPAVFIDTHTTNGSFHRYIVTYEGPRNPAGFARLTDYARDTMFPRITADARARFGIETFPYGDFTNDHAAWETFPPEGRYATNYFGLRNRISILSEGYSYATYKDRVLGTRDFVKACLDDIAAHKDEIRKLFAEADAATSAPLEPGATPARVAIRSKAVAAPAKVMIKGFVEEQREGKTVSTGQPKDYQTELRTWFEPTLSVDKPAAYILPRDATVAIETLQRHGLDVEETREDIDVPVEVYTVRSVARSPREFQKHSMVTAEVDARAETRRIAAGAALVRTDQRLGHLATYLLEPQSEDGLATWNYFDDAMKEGAEFPVLRVPRATPITSGPWRKLAEERGHDLPLTFEAMYESDKPPNFAGSPVGNLAWLEDGEHFLQWKGGKLRKVAAATGAGEVFATTDAMEKALAGLPSIGEKTAHQMVERAWGNTSPDRTGALFNHESDLYYATFDGSVAVRLTSTPEPEELTSFSPDGRFVAFVRKNNLYVVDVKTQTERALTTDGAEHVLNGKADWVYYEEVFDRNWRTYWWSPDSRRLAFYRTDNSVVPSFTIVDELGAPQSVERTDYPRPGEPNPRVKLGIVGVAGGPVVFADMGAYETDGHLIFNVGWFPDASTVWCYVQDRVQSWLDLCAVSMGGKVSRLFRETTGAWVSSPPPLTFLKDGSFLFSSERTGYEHLYRYARDGTLKGAVTSGPWETRGIARYDDKAGVVYVRAMKDSPIAENLYRVNLENGEIERLTTAPGSHRVEVNPTGTMFIDTWSSRAAPTVVALRRLWPAPDGAPAGSVVRMLDTNPVHALDEYRFGERGQFQVTLKDGFQVEAAWTKPPDFDPKRKYPVWFMTYAGPHAPTIGDSWGDGGAYDQVLASAGLVVFRADPRGASGKGAVSSWTSYKQLGAPELADIVETITWLKTANPWIDGSRIGMSGFSFGGYMTAYAMTHSDVFAAGIAGGTPADWREYDTVYTERYMLTPQQNPDGYDKTSIIKGAKDLKGRLMLMHGTIDDNVHAANTWKLARALQQSGKQFEMMLYPGFRHGIAGNHYRRFMYDWILRTLHPESAVYQSKPDGALGP